MSGTLLVAGAGLVFVAGVSLYVAYRFIEAIPSPGEAAKDTADWATGEFDDTVLEPARQHGADTRTWFNRQYEKARFLMTPDIVTGAPPDLRPAAEEWDVWQRGYHPAGTWRKGIPRRDVESKAEELGISYALGVAWTEGRGGWVT